MFSAAMLARVEDLARRAGRLALSHYGRASFELKGDTSPVSVADREVEALLRRELRDLDPGAAYIGEETARDPAAVQRAREAERVWVVDPIDGTAAYLGELDVFAVCIGLLQRGEPVAGVVVLPALGFTERHGTYTNCHGEAQEFYAGPYPAGSVALADWEILARLGSHLGAEFPWTGFREVPWREDDKED